MENENGNEDGIKSSLKEEDTKEKPLTPAQEVYEGMKKLYEEKTSQPYTPKKQYFVHLSALIKQHGLEAVKQKVVILATCCDRGEAWFAKDGWACFTPDKLMTHWNAIIPHKKYLSKEEQEAIRSEEFRKKLKENDDACAAIVAEAKRQRKAQSESSLQVAG